MSRAALSPRRLWADFRYRRLLRRLAGPRLMRAFADAYPQAFFVEIGANDGDKDDHVGELVSALPWRGILVEPVPYVFDRLRRRHAARDGLTLENVAISDRDGHMPFHHLAEAPQEERPRLPSWYDELGSFSRELVLVHSDVIPDIEQRIVTTEVPTLTFESLCRRHSVERLDLLLIDTEGWDWEVLRNVDLTVYHPRLLVYEHYHLDGEERAACRAHVEGAGYETMEEGFDTFCLDTGPADRLSDFWSRLRPAAPGASKREELAT